MARIGLIGANGYGIQHRRAIAPLHEAGTVELVGLCDLAPVQDAPRAPVPASAAVFTDYRELLAETTPDIAIIATPPHTHLEIASAAVLAGADVLIEKPPFLSLAEHESFIQLLEATGRAGQVGFQALGSAALTELTAAIHAGKLGAITGVGVHGAWRRPDAYYQRSPWAGRRQLNGRPVLDGALANPFAHAVMQALAVAGAELGGSAGKTELGEAAGKALDAVEVAGIELERYRARPIEVDDTGTARLRLSSGLPIVIAVTLCADVHLDPVVVVQREAGRAELGYSVDTLRLPGDGEARVVEGRVGLLANLIDHRAAPETVPLLAAVAMTASFTTLAEAIMAAPEPTTIGREFWTSHGTGSERVVTVPGASDIMRRAADELALPSELGVPWAVAPRRESNGGPVPKVQ
jgi:predicted dehydrogenase